MPQDSDPPLNLNGKIKGTLGVLVTIIVGVATIAGTVAGVYWKLPSKDDMKTMFADHNASSDAHPALAKSVSDTKTKVDRIAFRTERNVEDIKYIRDVLGYLTEQSIRQTAFVEASQNVTQNRARQAAEAAVTRFRQGAPPAAAVQDSLDDL